MKRDKIDILECTLRDGSYPIDFQFDEIDTAVIGNLLDDAGFSYVEIGHGVGLNASNQGLGRAACSDEDYLKAASENIKNAKFGMFFIPGIGKKEDIDLAHKYGMKFIRIGTNITQAEQAQPFIEYAKSIGMEVSSNLMKTYSLSPEEALKKAKLVEKWGVDIVTIVDSAGGMLPNEVTEYVSLFHSNLKCRIGYHGHNNLYLAIGNTIAAINAGATIVDTTMQGMGRSGGNAPTEVLILVLNKMGFELNIDLKKVLEIGNRIIKPLILKQGIEPVDIISGFAQFHSKYQNTVFEAALNHGVDPLDLIVKVSEIDKVHVSEDLANQMAVILKKENFQKNKPYEDIGIKLEKIKIHSNIHNTSFNDQMKAILRQMNILASKTKKKKILVLAKSFYSQIQSKISPFLRINDNFIFAQADLVDDIKPEEILQEFSDKVDFFILESCLQKSLQIDESIKNKVFSYDEIEIVSDSILLNMDFFGKKKFSNILVLGINDFTKKFANKFGISTQKPLCLLEIEKQKGFKLERKVEDGFTNITFKHIDPKALNPAINTLVCANLEGYSLPIEFLQNHPKISYILDTGFGNITPNLIKYAHENDIEIWRVNMGYGLISHINNIFLRIQYPTESLGKRTLDNGITIISDGYIWLKGSIIVDSIHNPTNIIGIADGKGKLLEDESIYENELKIVKKFILLNKLES